MPGVRVAGMAKHVDTEYVEQPFAGLADEAAWVAMREIIPAATGSATTTAEHGSRPVVVATVLPSGAGAVHRPDGTVMLSVQGAPPSDDLSADLAATLLAALAAEPGTAVAPRRAAEASGAARLQDVLEPAVPFELKVHDGYDFWLDASAEQSAEVKDSLAEAAEASTPTAPVPGVEHAYWCEMNAPFVRWVRPEPEDEVVAAIARLHAARASGIKLDGGAEAKFLGMFRAAGLTIPVWQLPAGTKAEALAAPMAAYAKGFEAALADASPLTPEQRRARSGILSRQVTLR